MLASLIIVFREVFEAGLVVGIVLGASRGVRHHGLWVACGVGAGVLGAVLVAVFADALSSAVEGAGQELFNAGILIVAVLMLSWHNIWMARHGKELAAQMSSVGRDVAAGSRPLYALATVVAVAVLREGAEVVLFLYGIAVSGGSSPAAMLAGGLGGLLLGAAVALLMFFGLVQIPTRYFFRVTSWIIAFLAAGMAAQAVDFLQRAFVLPVGQATVWDTSGILADDSLLGRMLHTLVGYTDRPSGLQLTAYLLTLVAIGLLMRRFGHTPPRTAAA